MICTFFVILMMILSFQIGKSCHERPLKHMEMQYLFFCACHVTGIITYITVSSSLLTNKWYSFIMLCMVQYQGVSSASGAIFLLPLRSLFA